MFYLYCLEMETDAKGDFADAATLTLVQERICCGMGIGIEVVVNGLVGIVDIMLAEAIVINTGAYMLTKIGTEADHPCQFGSGFIGVMFVAFTSTFRGDEEEISTKAKLCIRRDVIPQLVIEITDTGKQGYVEITGGAVLMTGKLFFPISIYSVPKNINLCKRSDLAKANIEAITGAVSETEAYDGFFAHILHAEGDNRIACRRCKTANGQYTIEEY